jgi:sporulation protein YlmC with PRC-barrel domain
MKKQVLIGAIASLLSTAPVFAQVAGTATVGLEAGVLQQVYTGWSAKKEILGQEVTNDKGEKVGRIDDLIITPEDQISYAIVGAGGFLGFDRHNVAIPIKQFKMEQGKLILPGATKQAIEAMPEFDWAKKK